MTQLSAELQNLLDQLVQGQENVRSGLLLVSAPGFFWKGASGIAFTESNTPAVPDDQFVVDSIGKMFTSSIIMLLAEENLLSVSAPIVHYLPAGLMQGLHVLNGHDHTHEITIEHLLTHTSGLRDTWADEAFLDLIVSEPERLWTPEESVEYIKEHCPPKFPPGRGFTYSDPGYNLLGLIIEAVTEKSLHQVAREKLLKPLGLDHTWRPSHEKPYPSLPERGVMERYLDDYECALLPAVITNDWAGGGLVSTTEDLKHFMRSFIDGEIFSNPATLDRMFSWVPSGPFHQYGFGVSRVLLDRAENPSYKGLGELRGHTGSSENFLYYHPQQDMILTGTLNQIECTSDLLDTVTEVLRMFSPGGSKEKT